jgi:hypothetical protein
MFSSFFPLVAIFVGVQGATLFDLAMSLRGVTQTIYNGNTIGNAVLLEIDVANNEGNWTVRNSEACVWTDNANAISGIRSNGKDLEPTTSGHMSFFGRVNRWNPYLHVRANGMFHVQLDLLNPSLSLNTRSSGYDKFFAGAGRDVLRTWRLMMMPDQNVNWTVELQFDWQPAIGATEDDIDLAFNWRISNSTGFTMNDSVSFTRPFEVAALPFQTMGQHFSRYCIIGWTISDVSEGNAPTTTTTTTTSRPTPMPTSRSLVSTSTTSSTTTTSMRTTSHGHNNHKHNRQQECHNIRDRGRVIWCDKQRWI